MYTDLLPNTLLASCRSIKNIHAEQKNKFDIADLQFQLCSNFLKQTKDKLCSKQIQLMTESEALINKLQQKNFINLKDVSATQDTTSYSIIQPQQQEDAFSQSCKSMMILRKSKSSTCVRRSESNYSSILRQIQKNCSQKTYQTISNLIEQNKKLKERISNIQKKEKQIKKKQFQYEKEQEQVLILKKKAIDFDRIVQNLNTEIQNLKTKAKDIDHQPKKSRVQQVAVPVFIEVQTSLKLFLGQKQQILTESSKKLKELYHEVQIKLQQPFASISQTCQKCCSMLKKIKGSIIKYRQLMEAEAEAVENLYQRFKNKLK